ncbi:Double-strand break repair protein mre11a [Nowakowskiella sp. JEL0407]|nr:Double-strand break repair protein mre11a [Nowakowskiella sp. JEL0407]
MEEADTLRVLVATDNHLGFLESDAVRGQDSFLAFEEILQLATAHHVDLLLLAGDLFHDNKPSRLALYNAMLLLRHYCLGPSPSQLQILSDMSCLSGGYPSINYLDPNYNVGLPVFSIHGNHDDPSGDGNHCALDLLHISGLVNYFGKQVNVDDIRINPVLMKKGNTKVALYGLGNVRDERLVRSFRKNRVVFLRPDQQSPQPQQQSEDGESDDPETTDKEWFNLLLIHQNRVKHGPNNYIPETFLSPFLDLIIWGHEHDCRIDPELNSIQDFYVSQPGSSIATSLTEGESVPKHVGLLTIHKKEFKMEKIRLGSVRPFIIEDVVLSGVQELKVGDMKGVQEYLVNVVFGLVDRARKEYCELNEIKFVPVYRGSSQRHKRVEKKRKPEIRKGKRKKDESEEESEEEERREDDSGIPKPLIRIRVDYSGGFSTFNPQQFGQAFVDCVANPKDIILFHRTKPKKRKEKGVEEEPDLEAFIPSKIETFKVEDLVSEFLNVQHLEILAEKELTYAVQSFVDKDDKDAIEDFVKDALEETRDKLHLKWNGGDEDELKEEMEKTKIQRNEEFEKNLTDGSVSDKKTTKKKKVAKKDQDEEMDDIVIEKPKSTRGRGGKTTTTSRAKKTPVKVDSDDDDDVIEITDTKPKRGTSTRAKVTTSKKKQVDSEEETESNQDEEEEVLPKRSTTRGSGSSKSKPAKTTTRGKSKKIASEDEVETESRQSHDEFDELVYKPPPVPTKKKATATSASTKSKSTVRGSVAKTKEVVKSRVVDESDVETEQVETEDDDFRVSKPTNSKKVDDSDEETGETDEDFPGSNLQRKPNDLATKRKFNDDDEMSGKPTRKAPAKKKDDYDFFDDGDDDQEDLPPPPPKKLNTRTTTKRKLPNTFTDSQPTTSSSSSGSSKRKLPGTINASSSQKKAGAGMKQTKLKFSKKGDDDGFVVLSDD